MWVRNNKGNVFVGNLPPDFSDERLAEAFDPYGIVLSAGVARDPNTGARLRYGFVDIATERAATNAISALDGTEIDGCKLNVKPRNKTAGPKKAGAGQQRRQPSRAPPTKSPPRNFAEAPRDSSDASPRLPFGKLSQSQRAMQDLPELEPPPRHDFEVVRRPLRRTTTPNFQVERRPLPRRV